MSLVFSYTPKPERERKYRSGKARPPGQSAWRAPEHAKLTSDMVRDFIRDEWGNAVSSEKFLIVDQRPEINIPKRKPYPAFL